MVLLQETNSHGKLLRYYVSQELKEPNNQGGIDSFRWISTQPVSANNLSFFVFHQENGGYRTVLPIDLGKRGPALHLCFKEHHSGLWPLGSSLQGKGYVELRGHVHPEPTPYFPVYSSHVL